VGAMPGVVDDPVVVEFEPEEASGVVPVLGEVGFELLAEVCGKVPQGEVVAAPGELGSMVEGCVVLPGVAGFVEVDPGTVDGTAGVAVPD
jgi:hypothetical protein